MRGAGSRLEHGRVLGRNRSLGDDLGALCAVSSKSHCAAVRLVRRQYRLLRAQLVRLQRRSSPSGVHDTRIAVRQLRTVLVALKPVLPRHGRHVLDRELKAIAEDLGDVRDARVRSDLLLPLLERRPIDRREKIISSLRKATRRASAHARRIYLSGAFDRRLGRMDRAIEVLTRKAHVSPSAKALLGEALLRRWLQLTQLTVALHARRLSSSEIHTLRMLVKKCRYLLASYSHVHSGRADAWLRRLQTCLGDLHDIAQARIWLRQQYNSDAFLRAPLNEREGRLRAELHELLRRPPAFVL
jgi:triphosphatase